MSTVVVRYQTHPEAADTNQHLIEQVFAELAAKQPDGLSYTSFRLDDGVTFVHIASTTGDKSPLDDLTAFAEFQREIRTRLAGPPEFQQATLVGRYDSEKGHD